MGRGWRSAFAPFAPGLFMCFAARKTRALPLPAQNRFATLRHMFTLKSPNAASGGIPETLKATRGIRGHDTYFPAVAGNMYRVPAFRLLPSNAGSAPSPMPPQAAQDQTHRRGWRCSFSERAKGLRFAPRKSRKKPESERRKRAAPTSPHAIFPYNSNPTNEIKFFKKSKFSGHSA